MEQRINKRANDNMDNQLTLTFYFINVQNVTSNNNYDVIMR